MSNYAERMTATPAKRLLYLTFVAVFVEIGYCIWAIMYLASVWTVPFLLAAYHSGYLLARLPAFRKTGKRNSLILTVSAVLTVAGIYSELWVISLATLPFFSASIQGTRRILKPQCKVPSRQKNVSKLAAMLFASTAALGSFAFALIVALISMVAVVNSAGTKGKAALYHGTSDGTQNRTLLWFELLHHAHYFAYCYTFWFLLPKALHPLIGVLFPIGWLGYWVLETLLREKTRYFSLWALFAGHLLSAAAILIMSLGDDITLIIVMWFLTGLGGGTAYMLSNVAPGGDREAFEDVGHVFGCLLAGALIWISADVRSSLWLGAGLAALAASVLLLRDRSGTPSQAEIR